MNCGLIDTTCQRQNLLTDSPPNFLETKLLFAMSPLIALFYIVYTGFEPEEVEMKKRKQKGDFQLDGHSE